MMYTIILMLIYNYDLISLHYTFVYVNDFTPFGFFFLRRLHTNKTINEIERDQTNVLK